MRRAEDQLNQQVLPYGLLASGVSGCSVEVHHQSMDAPAFTNGSTIYVNSALDHDEILAQVCFQSALIAAGSLSAEIMKPILRKHTLCQRYLCIEGHRAVTAIWEYLPESVCAYFKEAKPSGNISSTSPKKSLELAKSNVDINEFYLNVGRIEPRQVIANLNSKPGTNSKGAHSPRNQNKTLEELHDNEEQEEDSVDHDFSSPVGGGGGIGKWLQRLFSMVRSVNSGGSPGADDVNHWSASGAKSKASSYHSDADISIDAGSESGGLAAVYYPEWNVHKNQYHEDWCCVKEEPIQNKNVHASKAIETQGLHKAIAKLGFGLERTYRNPKGDDIDIDSLIEYQIQRRSGEQPNEHIFIDQPKIKRDLSVLIMIDISGSVSQTGTNGQSVHELQQGVCAALTTVFHECGEQVALYAFHSQGRHSVNIQTLKQFNEPLNYRIIDKLFNLIPGAYSRLGAAVRHGASELMEKSGTGRKLLIVLSDGLAYDHGYEPNYAAADVSKALQETRKEGIGCLCLNIGANTEKDILHRVFGSASYASLSKPTDLKLKIHRLILSALNSADMQRRIA